MSVPSWASLNEKDSGQYRDITLFAVRLLLILFRETSSVCTSRCLPEVGGDVEGGGGMEAAELPTLVVL